MLPNGHAFDQTLPLDVRSVVETANTLQVSEFDLFRDAYRRWFGDEPEIQRLEKIFVAYLYAEAVPPWVRQYCRESMTEHDASVGPIEATGGSGPTGSVGEAALPGFIALSTAFALLMFLVAAPASRPADAASQACFSGAFGLVERIAAAVGPVRADLPCAAVTAVAD